jgi:transmembrane E3 ubiquitin-protein ligase
MLPALVPEVVRNDTAYMIGPELQAKIDKMKNLIDAGIVDNEASGSGTWFLSCFDCQNTNYLL